MEREISFENEVDKSDSMGSNEGKHILAIPFFRDFTRFLLTYYSIRQISAVPIRVFVDGGCTKQLLDWSRLQKDRRLSISLRQHNKGIGFTRQEILEFAEKNQITYVTMMDCGDLLINADFERRIAKLSGTSAAVLATSAILVDKNGLPKLWRPLSCKLFRDMIPRTLAIQPACMFSVSQLNGLAYSPVRFCEDLLFFEVAYRQGKLDFLDEVTVICPQHTGMTSEKRQEMLIFGIEMLNEAKKIGPEERSLKLLRLDLRLRLLSAKRRLQARQRR